MGQRIYTCLCIPILIHRCLGSYRGLFLYFVFVFQAAESEKNKDAILKYESRMEEAETLRSLYDVCISFLPYKIAAISFLHFISSSLRLKKEGKDGEGG